MSKFFEQHSADYQSDFEKNEQKNWKFFRLRRARFEHISEQRSAEYQSDFEKIEQKKCAKSSAPQAENFQNLNADFYDFGGN